jgi:Flp pilus assembly protein TadD
LIQRIVLIAASMTAIVVLAIWAHSTRLASEGAAFKPSPTNPVTPAQVRAALSELRRASNNNPDTTPDVDEAIVLTFLGRNDEAARILTRVVGDEPKNARAWGQLAVATRQSDPALSAAAVARVRQLVPALGG